MPGIRVLIMISLFTFCAVNSAIAQEIKPTQSASAATITVAASADRVRFTSSNTVVQMHLQVYDNAGQLVFDVSSKGNVLDWTLQDSGGARLIPGAYLSVVTVKSLSGKLSQRIGSVSVQEKQIELQRADAVQLTAAQQQAVGPIEENGVLTILKAGETEATTVVAHDGTQGEVTRSRGALSFRLGDFFSGKDEEQMRLTEEGNLGIGTDSPQAKLDVAGVIRTRDGIEFANKIDGTDGTNGTNGTNVTKLTTTASGSLQQTLADGTVVTNATGTGTQNRLAKWTDNAGTLGDGGVYESGGLVVIGQNASGQVAPLAAVSGQYHTLEVGVPPGGKSPLTLAGGSGVMEFWKDLGGGVGNPAAAVSFGMAVPGTPATNDMLYSSYTAGNQWHERMRLTSAGNLGIGTTAPTQKLEVAGNVKVSGNGNGLIFPDATMMTSAGIGQAQADARYAQLSAANSFTGNQSVTGNVNASGSISGGSGSFSGNLTADTTSLFVDATNHRVGVGTSGPANKLSVNGNADFTGNVGIGTTAPLSQLDVRGDIFLGLTAIPDSPIGNNSLFIANDGSPAAVDPHNSLRIDGALNNLYLIARSGPGSTKGTGIIFRTATAGAGEADQVKIDESGNVGVGTTSPGQKLEVVGNLKVSGNGNRFIFADGTGMATAGATLGANNFIGNQSVTGTISATGSINAGTQYNIGGQRVMSNAGFRNMFVGEGAGINNTSGNNSFFGYQAGLTNTTGNDNSFFGHQAGLANTSGAGNSFFGYIAGSSNTTGGSNAFFGWGAGNKNTTGFFNSFFGVQAGQLNTTGSENSFFGLGAGQNNTTGFSNAFFGLGAGQNNTTGFQNSFFARGAGSTNTTGNNNAFFGTEAGVSNTTGGDNAFFGYLAGNQNKTASGNSFFGRSAGQKNTTGAQNAFFGYSAGVSNTTGDNNSFFGWQAGTSNTTGGLNSFFGQSAGQSNMTGVSNSFFGQSAGISNSTGGYNSFFGIAAGQSNTAGLNLTIIGAAANVGVDNLTNASAIGANASVTQSNSLVLGSINGVNFATADTNVGIGTTAPGQKLEVMGNVKVSGTGNGFLFSDGTTMTTAGLTTTSADARYAQLAAANNFNGNQSVTGNVSATGAINADTQYNIGGSRVLSVGGSFNLFLGFGTGASNTTGFSNSFFGFQAGATNDTGSANSFFGDQSGNKNAGGGSNSFFGSSAGANNTSGGGNSFFGSGAGSNNLTGGENSFFGSGAGLENTASGNSFFGSSAGLKNSNGFDNSFFGKQAGQFNDTGISNSFFGAWAGNANTSGQSNSFFGWNAGSKNQTGTQNSFFGYLAGSKNLNGSSNSFFGLKAGNNNTSGDINSFFGPSAGSNNISGTGNTFLGSGAGLANKVENDNTFIGHSADGAPGITNATAIGANASVIQSNSLVLGSGVNVGIGTSAPGQKLEVAGNVKVSGTGNGFIFSDGSSMNTAGLTTASGDVRYAQLAAANSFNGNQSVTGTISATGAVNAGTQYNIAGSRVMSNTGIENMFVGSGSGNANSGSFGSFFGNNAGQHNTSGDGNSFFGDSAGQINITGQYNSFFGTNAGQNNSGSYNSFFGGLAGQGNTSGSGNTVVGQLAGLSNTTENNNTFIGYQANGFAGITNATAIGANASVTQSNSVVLGNGVNVGIGTTKPNAKLQVTSGDVFVDTIGRGLILKSSHGSCFRVTVDDFGALNATSVSCP